MGMLAAFCLVVAIVGFASAADPDANDPDATESLGIHFEKTAIASVIARPDGSLLTLSGEPLGGQHIESLLADGTPDPAGPAFPQVPGESRLFPVAGGRTLVLGYRKLMRLNADGSIDTSFGRMGTIAPPYGAQVVDELGSGRLAVVSTEVGGTHTVSAAVRVELLSQDGTVVKGGGFSASLNAAHVSLGGNVKIPQITPTSDGGALVIGDDFLVELNADGSVNGRFGGGVVEGAYGLVGGSVLPDGSVEAVGTDSDDLALYRFTPSGDPDSAFGPQGMRKFDASGGGQDQATSASWGADGSVIVGGRTESSGSCSEDECEEVPLLAAFDAAGELETGFAQGGMLRLSSLAAAPGQFRSMGVTAMTRRPDGTIIAAGNAPPNETTGFIAAVSPEGAPVPGFGEGGIAPVRDPLRASQEVVGLAAMPDGGLLAAGTTDVGIDDQPILIRYAADDSLDRDFGGGTGYTVLHPPRIGYPHGATGFAVDGKNVLAGVYDSPLSHLLMARAADGSPVASFGSDGSVELPSRIRTAALAFAGDGDPLVLGIHHGAGGASTDAGVVVRYRPDGSLDDAFGDGGKFTVALGGHPVRGEAIVAGPGERILVGGSIGDRFVITSLLPDGRPDPHFGADGWSNTKVEASTHHLVLRRAGSHIYLAGTIGEPYGSQHVLLMRFDRNGRLDRSFGHGGRLVAPIAGAEHPTSVLPTPDGVLVVLSGGSRPLLTFALGGKVRSRPVAPGTRYPGDVRATISGDQLVVGWTSYSSTSRGQVYYLARRPLDRP